MLAFLAGSALAVVGTSLFGYLTHRALHEKWMGRFYEKHMAHHEKLYPANDFFSEGSYRSAGKDSTVWTFVLLGMPILLAPPALAWMGVVSMGTGFAVVGTSAVIGLLHDFVHDKVHVKDSVFQNLPVFKDWVKLHFKHHVDMTKNFGIFSFVWDRVFKTFEK